jgi:hypothetical protein
MRRQAAGCGRRQARCSIADASKQRADLIMQLEEQTGGKAPGLAALRDQLAAATVERERADAVARRTAELRRLRRTWEGDRPAGLADWQRARADLSAGNDAGAALVAETRAVLVRLGDAIGQLRRFGAGAAGLRESAEPYVRLARDLDEQVRLRVVAATVDALRDVGPGEPWRWARATWLALRERADAPLRTDVRVRFSIPPADVGRIEVRLSGADPTLGEPPTLTRVWVVDADEGDRSALAPMLRRRCCSRRGRCRWPGSISGRCPASSRSSC